MFDESQEKRKAKMLFLKTCKKISWPNKAELVVLFLDFCYDSSNVVDASTLSLLLIYLLEVRYIAKDHIKSALKKFTKTYSEYEADAPKINCYFANICFELIQKKIVKLSFINECFLNDTMIDQRCKKVQIFGRRADFLFYILKKKSVTKVNIKSFLKLNSGTATDFKMYYKLK